MPRDFSRCNAEAAKSTRQNHALRCTSSQTKEILATDGNILSKQEQLAPPPPALLAGNPGKNPSYNMNRY
jgi:hypothetical protein